jgi:hypothetical protein
MENLHSACAPLWRALLGGRTSASDKCRHWSGRATRECRPLKSDRPSTPSSTASPSRTNELHRLRSAASDISGNHAPILTVKGKQPHALAVTLHDQAVTIVLDFVKPPSGTLASGCKVQTGISACRVRYLGTFRKASLLAGADRFIIIRAQFHSFERCSGGRRFRNAWRLPR